MKCRYGRIILWKWTNLMQFNLSTRSVSSASCCFLLVRWNVRMDYVFLLIYHNSVSFICKLNWPKQNINYNQYLADHFIVLNLKPQVVCCQWLFLLHIKLTKFQSSNCMPSKRGRLWFKSRKIKIMCSRFLRSLDALGNRYRFEMGVFRIHIWLGLKIRGRPSRPFQLDSCRSPTCITQVCYFWLD